MVYNRYDENVTDSQWGGTLVVAFNRAVTLVVETGMVTTRLGRWSWMTYDRGWMGKLRVFMAYRAQKRTNPKAIGTINQQQYL